ncbi:MAG: (d)CMP kinase [Syntrophobacteraceae bacterium]
MIIAVDGPAGAGKSTVCKILAKRLGFVYLDTGAMYRALAWALNTGSAEPGLQPKADPDEDQVRELLERRIPLFFFIKENRLEISYGERLLSEELRSPEMSEAASRISRLRVVREFLVAWQRKLAEQGNIVAEGRDTATVVFPKADLKVFLTADLQARAKRRFAEYTEKGISLSLEDMQERIRERDEADSNRDHSPMRPAEGAILLDTSHLSIEEAVVRLSEQAEELINAGSPNCR